MPSDHKIKLKKLERGHLARVSLTVKPAAGKDARAPI
jgi:hypothetical protein